MHLLDCEGCDDHRTNEWQSSWSDCLTAGGGIAQIWLGLSDRCAHWLYPVLCPAPSGFYLGRC